MLKDSFFDRDPSIVAKDLLGKIIYVKQDNLWLAARIIETEAYYLHEKASHSSLGYTEKRKALFMSAGTIYMYHSRAGDSLNISCHGEGNAVLIKSGIPYEKAKNYATMIAKMQQLNPQKNSVTLRAEKKLCSGQTLLCKSLGLKIKNWDQKKLTKTQFYFADDNTKPTKIIIATRLGIAPHRDAHLMLRFIDYDNAEFCTSNPLKKKKHQLNRDYFFEDVA